MDKLNEARKELDFLASLMPKKWVRPPIDEQKLKEWTQGYAESSIPKGELFLELWISGCWLAEQLYLLGIEEDDIQDAQFAQGQMAFLSGPWVAAEKVLESHKSGQTIQPGPELAEKITEQLLNGAENSAAE